MNSKRKSPGVKQGNSKNTQAQCIKNLENSIVSHIIENQLESYAFADYNAVGRYLKHEYAADAEQYFAAWFEHHGEVYTRQAQNYFNQLPADYDYKDLGNSHSVRMRKFQLVSGSELTQNLKPIPWLIKGMLPADSVGLMFGEPAAGKSFLSLLLSACIGSGTDFAGRPIKRQGKVVYLAGEGNHGISHRLKAIQLKHGISVGNVHVSNMPVLLDSDEVKQIAQSIKYAVGEKISLVIVDTLARHMAGDESNAGEFNKLLKVIYDLKQHFKCSVLLVHHSGHSDKGRSRGSSAIKGAMDFEFQVKKSVDLISMICTKSKDYLEPEDLTFKLVEVDTEIVDDDGSPVVSATLVSTYEKPPIKLKESEKILLKQIRDNSPISRSDLKQQITGAIRLSSTGNASAEDRAFSRGLKLLERHKLIRIDDSTITDQDTGTKQDNS